MRTVFVNPRRRRAKKHSRKRARSRRRNNPVLSKLRSANSRLRGKVRNMQMLANPRRRSRSRRRARGRSRRRNAGIAPFVSNPLILNPRASFINRRRRRSNPGMPSLNTAMSKALTYGGGAALGAAANVFALNKISNDYIRNGARVVAAIFAGPMLKGEMGAAAAGALMYPVMVELAALVGLPVEGTEADLDLLAADLEDVLSEEEASELYDSYA